MEMKEINSIQEARLIIKKCEQAVENASKFTKSSEFDALSSEEKANRFRDLAKMEKDLDEVKSKMKELEYASYSFDDFCKSKDEEDKSNHIDGEAVTLDNNGYLDCEVRKNDDGKFEVVFGKSVLCVCDHHCKARTIAIAITDKAKHYAISRKLGPILKDGFNLEKIAEAVKDIL